MDNAIVSYGTAAEDRTAIDGGDAMVQEGLSTRGRRIRDATTISSSTPRAQNGADHASKLSQNQFCCRRGHAFEHPYDIVN